MNLFNKESVQKHKTLATAVSYIYSLCLHCVDTNAKIPVKSLVVQLNFPLYYYIALSETRFYLELA